MYKAILLPLVPQICASAIASAAMAMPSDQSSPDAMPTTAIAQSAPLQHEARSDSAIRPAIYFENDGTIGKPNNNTDRHYTTGVAASMQWRAPWVQDMVGALPSWDDEFAASRPDVSAAMGAIVALEIYTPQRIALREPIYDDRPYAGWAYVGFMAQRATRQPSHTVFEHLQLDLGTLGRSSNAHEVQKGVHRLFEETEPGGWDYQVRDDFAADFKYVRRYRYDLVTPLRQGGFGLQILPEAGSVLGTTHTNFNAAATLRAGWNLPDDFGPGSLQTPADFTAPRPTPADFSLSNLAKTLGGYVYLRPAGRAVIHDTTIEGSLFHGDPVTQEAEDWVGQIRAGFVITVLRYVELGYSQTFTTHEFVGQHGTDAYGAWTLAVTYDW